MKTFLPLLNQPARSCPLLPKFWTALATVIVEIFFQKKFWCAFRPISVAYQKEFWISWKKRRFQIFQKPLSPGFQSFLHKATCIDFIFLCLTLFHLKLGYLEHNRWEYTWNQLSILPLTRDLIKEEIDDINFSA